MADDRRKSSRYHTDGEFCTIRDADGNSRFAVIEDMSVGGLRLELTGEPTHTGIGEKAPVFMVQAPKDIRELLEGRWGEVCWHLGGRCGVKFKNPIPMSEDELENYLTEKDFSLWM